MGRAPGLRRSRPARPFMGGMRVTVENLAGLIRRPVRRPHARGSRNPLPWASRSAPGRMGEMPPKEGTGHLLGANVLICLMERFLRLLIKAVIFEKNRVRIRGAIPITPAQNALIESPQAKENPGRIEATMLGDRGHNPSSFFEFELIEPVGRAMSSP